MARVTVVLDVDETIIKDVSGHESLEAAVAQELGWLHDSGMLVDSVRLHESFYLKLDENREWTAMVDNERPCEDAVLFVEEQEYPAEFYYSRTDLNGSSCIELDVCKNREEMLQSLNWMGKCGYMPLKVWDFDAKEPHDKALFDIFDAGLAKRAEAAREEMDGLMGLDDLICAASPAQNYELTLFIGEENEKRIQALLTDEQVQLVHKGISGVLDTEFEITLKDGTVLDLRCIDAIEALDSDFLPPMRQCDRDNKER